MAHSNFQRAIELYHPTYQHHLERKSLLKVSAMVLANLCVAFIMDEKNPEAEEIMKEVELEEERRKLQKPGTPVRMFSSNSLLKHNRCHSSAAHAFVVLRNLLYVARAW